MSSESSPVAEGSQGGEQIKVEPQEVPFEFIRDTRAPTPPTSRPPTLQPAVVHEAPITALDETSEGTPLRQRIRELPALPEPHTLGLSVGVTSTGKDSGLALGLDTNTDELYAFLSTCDPPLTHLHPHLVAYGLDMNNLKILARREVAYARSSIDRLIATPRTQMDKSVRPIDWDHLEFYIYTLRPRSD
ncbi:hypothetical protein BDN72DRAFT_486459 [Pluteus cervinus]|uniref:Uncharacterized protein n=1 Tax=Pluteus cervinus TaxID=181527 RepID=A0ACD3AZ21_9AGAR|nr:hypothetical protein BDN72DRAFT_486459 [Pluteus cervinus]